MIDHDDAPDTYCHRCGHVRRAEELTTIEWQDPDTGYREALLVCTDAVACTLLDGPT